MKHEHAPKISQISPPCEATEGQLDRRVNGTTADDKVDLRQVVVGEYRFQGTLVRAFYISGRTWFVASEVCAALEIANPRDAIKLIDPDEKGVGIIYTLGGEQSVNLVNESALYFLIFKSRKPQARAFRRWVTGEVLPQIRQTGAYAMNGRLGQDGSIVLPPLDGATRYVVVGLPGKPPHIRRTGAAEMLAENTSLDIQGLCYALKGVEVWWNKVQILGRSTSARDEGFSAHMLEKAILEGAGMADKYLSLLKYLEAAE